MLHVSCCTFVLLLDKGEIGVRRWPFARAHLIFKDLICFMYSSGLCTEKDCCHRNAYPEGPARHPPSFDVKAPDPLCRPDLLGSNLVDSWMFLLQEWHGLLKVNVYRKPSREFTHHKHWGFHCQFAESKQLCFLLASFKKLPLHVFYIKFVP